jgi:transposase
MVDLKMNLQQHTIVFDRGNNSKKNLTSIRQLELHYVGALTPYHHQQLIKDAEGDYQEVKVGVHVLNVFRDKRQIWGEERTVLVFVSHQLKDGQLRGIYQALSKREKQLSKLQDSLANPKAKKRERKELEATIETLLKGQYMEGLIQWSLEERSEAKFVLTHKIDQTKLHELEDKLGFRILMTDRHDWEIAEIINCYYGQSEIEHAFKNIKNPYHLAITPGFHWTDQKIRVHFFICVLGFQLTAIIWRMARENADFGGTLDNLLDILNNVRLGTVLEDSKTPGKMKAFYKLEEMDAV